MERPYQPNYLLPGLAPPPERGRAVGRAWRGHPAGTVSP